MRYCSWRFWTGLLISDVSHVILRWYLLIYFSEFSECFWRILGGNIEYKSEQDFDYKITKKYIESHELD